MGDSIGSFVKEIDAKIDIENNTRISCIETRDDTWAIIITQIEEPLHESYLKQKTQSDVDTRIQELTEKISALEDELLKLRNIISDINKEVRLVAPI